MPHLDEKKKETIYASPWVGISDAHFVRYVVDIHAESNPYNDKPVLGRVTGKVKKGVASWTWNVMVYGSHYARATGSCRNKREAFIACENALKQERIILLKQKHFSFL